MPVATQSQPPCQFTAGDTVIFTLSGTVYPASLWYCDYVLSRNGQNLATVRATTATNGTDFLVTLTNSTSNVAPGSASWIAIVTEIASGERKAACSGNVAILYNPTASLAQTPNQILLAACNAAILTLNTTPTSRVNFNGQEFYTHNIKDLFTIRDRLQTIVWDELRQMGIAQPGGAKRIQNRFCA